jgi:hypothetical protein
MEIPTLPQKKTTQGRTGETQVFRRHGGNDIHPSRGRGRRGCSRPRPLWVHSLGSKTASSGNKKTQTGAAEKNKEPQSSEWVSMGGPRVQLRYGIV